MSYRKLVDLVETLRVKASFLAIGFHRAAAMWQKHDSTFRVFMGHPGHAPSRRYPSAVPPEQA